MSDHVLIVEVCVSVALLWFAYSFMFQKTRTDAFQEDLFTIRDELFDYMSRYNVPFDLPAYRAMRDLLNGAIRVAHFLSLFSIVYAGVVRSRSAVSPNTVQLAIGNIDDTDVREHYQYVYLKVQKRFLQYFFLEGLRSLIFTPLYRYMKRLGMRPRVRAFVSGMRNELLEEFVQFGKKDSLGAHILLAVTRGQRHRKSSKAA
ncbi:MAG TPA: hypothetical protein PK539_00905 [Candidatus Paceibacterota bacterium]|nr:hypothetical protein [Candidatus Paceibacterota bacterium]